MTGLGDSGYPLLQGNNPENSWKNQNGKIGNWTSAIDDVSTFSTAPTNSEACPIIYTLSTNKALGYDLGACAKLIRLHRKQSPNLINIGHKKWKYSPVDLTDGQPLVVLSEKGSGVTSSPRSSVVSFITFSRFSIQEIQCNFNGRSPRIQ